MPKKLIAAELESFNRMFAQLANQSNTICWMRSLDYKRQLYISPNFETIFGDPASKLYEHPESWNNYLLPIDSSTINQTISSRLNNLTINDGNNHMFFRIGSPDGNVHYLRDWSILICNKLGEAIAIAGVGEKISPEQWYTLVQSSNKNSPTLLPGGVSLNDILHNEAKLQSISIDIDHNQVQPAIKNVNCIRVNNITVPLSKREADCLYHLRLGHSAKETGKILFISPRTVETHIENIKQKACVKTKLELLTQLIPINTMVIDK
ncbi:MAG: LuxR C-terminal-related transcriptional regulator [Gammaproteobacteria bacterium]|nr:LuxR C-terminal-related transcriptional regulator [Gammaproteobacteria bacterium]